MRESAEEVGVDLTRARWIGALSDVAPRTPVLPPIAVRPFVFALPARLDLRLNAEVASAHWVELTRLADPDARLPTTVVVSGDPLVVPAFVVEDMVVWGMTERILASFFQAIS